LCYISQAVRRFPRNTILIAIAFLLLSNAAGPGKGVCAVQPDAAQKPDRERLMAAARAGGDYLVRMQKRNGSFHYYYNAGTNRFETRRYNIVRHAGTALSLLDLYAATRDDRYLVSARRAISFLKTRFRSARRAGAAYVLDYDGKAKLGASALSLAALARQIELDRSFADRRSANLLANLILGLQRSDGSFAMRYRLKSSDDRAFQSLYYPGEALLGLIRLFRVNGDRRLLGAARLGAQFLIESQRRMDALPADAWLIQALEALYQADPQTQYAGHAIALAEAMIVHQYGDDSEFAGGFGPGIPRSTPAASRAEGLVSAYRLARAIGDARSDKIAGALRRCARFQLSQQFTIENSGTLPNRDRAIGGFREGLASNRIRIDFVQHNISSLLGIVEALD
jgi:hypothetical protein